MIKCKNPNALCEDMTILDGIVYCGRGAEIELGKQIVITDPIGYLCSPSFRKNLEENGYKVKIVEVKTVDILKRHKEGECKL